MKTKQRNPILAGILSILVLGLGQIYNGQIRKGIIIFFSFIVLYFFLVPVTGLIKHFNGLVILLIIVIIFYLIVILDSILVAIRKKEIVLKSYNQWYIYLLVIILINGFYLIEGEFIRYEIWGVRAFSIPTGSMEPTLLVGDYLMVDLKYYEDKDPQLGDLIVFKYPRDPNLLYIKRLIAGGNQVVEIKDRSVFIDGVLFPDSLYVKHIDSQIFPRDSIQSDIYPSGAGNRDNYGPVVVPEDSYFFLGDNRENALDSRYWGYVSREEIVGRALYIYWSKEKNRIGLKFN